MRQQRLTGRRKDINLQAGRIMGPRRMGDAWRDMEHITAPENPGLAVTLKLELALEDEADLLLVVLVPRCQRVRLEVDEVHKHARSHDRPELQPGRHLNRVDPRNLDPARGYLRVACRSAGGKIGAVTRHGRFLFFHVLLPLVLAQYPIIGCRFRRPPFVLGANMPKQEDTMKFMLLIHQGSTPTPRDP